MVDVTVTEAVFHDRSGERLRARPGRRPPGAPLLPAPVDPTPVARLASAVRLVMLAPSTRVAVRAGTLAATAIGLSSGVLLPTAPCRSITARDRAALWLGPDEWLILAPAHATSLAGQAAKAAAEHPASVVDVSHRTLAVEVAGPRATWCLNTFCALDLDAAVFPVGMCTRTLLGKAEVILWRVGAEDFHVEVPRSLLSYVWACLEEARLEFLDTV